MAQEMTKLAPTTIAVVGAGLALLTGSACGTANGQVTAHRTGVVVGKFVREGGPIKSNGQQPPKIPLSGLVKFTSPGNRTVEVRVGANGTFSVRLRPGRYSVSGRSSDIVVRNSGQRHMQPTWCSPPVSVNVTRGHTSTITVACLVP